jgi:Arc/MetJ-type ribon-helix-helix transcriptional regulator
MRKIVNISLPAELNREVEKEVKEGKFASKSEFFRHILRFWKLEQGYRRIQEAERDVAAGRVMRLKSLKDLE